MYDVILLTPARKNLFEIGDYYSSEFGPSSAKKVIEQIEAAIKRLEMFPNSGTLTPDSELNREGYRMVISGDFVAIYRLIEDVVFVYYVCNTQLDYISLFRNS